MAHTRRSSSLQAFARVGAMLVIAISMAACDPLWKTSVSQPLERPLVDTCVVRVLQSSEQIRSVRRHGEASLVAVLILPPTIHAPRSTQGGGEGAFEILQSRTKEGKIEFTFRMVGVGRKGNAEFHRYVEETMRKLQDAVVEACSRQADD
jgi:hypothetical protein